METARDQQTHRSLQVYRVVVGDLAKIESSVRALNLGEVSVVDADGKPVAGKTAAK